MNTLESRGPSQSLNPDRKRQEHGIKTKKGRCKNCPIDSWSKVYKARLISRAFTSHARLASFFLFLIFLAGISGARVCWTAGSRAGSLIRTREGQCTGKADVISGPRLDVAL